MQNQQPDEYKYLSDRILIEHGFTKEQVTVMNDEQKLAELTRLDLKEQELSQCHNSQIS